MEMDLAKLSQVQLFSVSAMKEFFKSRKYLLGFEANFAGINYAKDRIIAVVCCWFHWQYNKHEVFVIDFTRKIAFS